MRLKKIAEVQPPALVGRELTLEFVRVTERAAIAAAKWLGKGDERAADEAASGAMHSELGRVRIRGTVVVGESDESSLLHIGERVGTGDGPEVDVAVDPLEGTTLCAKNQHDALCVLAVAQRGALLNVPDVYMHKIAIGPGYPQGVVDLDATAGDNIRALAEAKKVPVTEITTCVLDRPRHAPLIEELRGIGVGIRLIGDGDIAGVIHAANTDESGIDIYLGSGGAHEGVMAAAALRCLGDQMQGRLILDTPDKLDQARHLGISDRDRKYELTDLAGGDVMFSATGVTDGSLISGVKVKPGYIQTSTIITRSWSGTVRWVTARHAR